MFEALLEYLQQTHGFQITGYKRPTIMRRVSKRMKMLGIEDFGRYSDYLQAHPEEFPELFNTILINVTSFFRDPDAWDYFAKAIVAKILAEKEEGHTIKIWNAGCASGEESYTIATVLAEALGDDEFRRSVKIYATDIDESALAQARQGTYKAVDLQEIPLFLREKYFEPAEDHFEFRRDLRRSILFGRHDLLTDPPISKLDLLICRNTLMYFNSTSQRKIVANFHFALNDKGYLFLGKSELLLSYYKLFTPVDKRYRIFSKVRNVNSQDRLLILNQARFHEDVKNHPEVEASRKK
jgi:two-component system CheB/CheR fusion protein